MVSEAQKRASKKFWLNHKDYYNKKSKEWAKKVRDERKEYKQRIDKAIEILEKQMPVCIMPNNTLIHGTEKAKVLEDLLNILEGKDEFMD